MIRIDNFWKKSSYAAICVLVYYVVGVLVIPLNVYLDSVGIAHGILIVCMVVFGARMFRAHDEGRGPRPWWKFSARERLGFVLGSTFAVLAIFLTVGWHINDQSGTPLRRYSFLITDCLVAYILAFFYLNSSFRLYRQRKLTRQN